MKLRADTSCEVLQRQNSARVSSATLALFLKLALYLQLFRNVTKRQKFSAKKGPGAKKFNDFSQRAAPKILPYGEAPSAGAARAARPSLPGSVPTGKCF